MGEKMKWTPQNIQAATHILGKNRRMSEAMAQIFVKFGISKGDEFSLEAMRRAFRRNKWPSPHWYLGREVTPVKISDITNSSIVPGTVAKTSYAPPTNVREWVTKTPISSETLSQSSMSDEFFLDVVTNQFKADLRRNSSILNQVKSGKMKVQVVNTADKKTSRILIISDLHVPYHDVKAWECVLQVIRETKPDVVVIIGDFADMYSISSHPKSLDRKMNFATERDAVNAALDQVRLAAGNACRIVFCEGNHEDRITRYLQSSAPELGGIKEIRAEGLFKIKQRNIEWVPYRTEIKIGNCAFTHDVGRCGVNTARQSLLDYGGNLVVGHSHRGAVVYQGEIKGSSHFCLNVGWLGDVEAIDYVHRARAKRDWQLGFGLVDQDEAGYSWAQFIPVLDGRCVVDGKLISGQQQSMAA
jgi:predicted phosphodiesterase